MGFGVVEFAEVATHKTVTVFTDIAELSFIATAMHLIEDVVVLV